MKPRVAVIQVESVGFDYGQLIASLRIDVQQETAAIQKMLTAVSANVLQIGLRLNLVHGALGRDKFQAWLKAEFAWSQATASNYMRAATVFGHLESLDGWQPSALYLLARKRVPAGARNEALCLARAGTKITKANARSLIAKHSAAMPGGRSRAASIELKARFVRALAWLKPADAKRLLDELLAMVQEEPVN